MTSKTIPYYPIHLNYISPISTTSSTPMNQPFSTPDHYTLLQNYTNSSYYSYSVPTPYLLYPISIPYHISHLLSILNPISIRSFYSIHFLNLFTSFDNLLSPDHSFTYYLNQLTPSIKYSIISTTYLHLQYTITTHCITHSTAIFVILFKLNTIHNLHLLT